MNTFRKLLYAFVVAAVVVGLLVFLGNGSAGQDAPQAPERKAPPTNPDLPETATTEVKKPPVNDEPKVAAKVITMAEAVTIAEKSVKGGYTLRAERTERPVVGFQVEVIATNGTRSVVDLTADGKVKTKRAGATLAPPSLKKGKEGQKRMDR